ncbi:hypothetical protein [Mycolicibacterium stellerae]|uniref:hypothetical protein n=1 Tax=Mycolicibacterium stellerae TaxID=2358193 RepID=UPI000F0B7F4C|nr:hypothetical protein [Mycolicibacterium stellerae]
MNRRRWIVVGAGVAAALLLVVAGTVGFVLVSGSKGDTSSAPKDVEGAAVRQWWSTAQGDFEELKDTLATANRAVDKQVDPNQIEDTCQQLHDTAQVKLQAHLPSPDPDLTAEIAAAIQDIHNASHMCLSVIAGSMNSYGGEFSSDLQQGEKHLEAALDIINKSDL